MQTLFKTVFLKNTVYPGKGCNGTLIQSFGEKCKIAANNVYAAGVGDRNKNIHSLPEPRSLFLNPASQSLLYKLCLRRLICGNFEQNEFSFQAQFSQAVIVETRTIPKRKGFSK